MFWFVGTVVGDEADDRVLKEVAKSSLYERKENVCGGFGLAPDVAVLSPTAHGEAIWFCKEKDRPC